MINKSLKILTIFTTLLLVSCEEKPTYYDGYIEGRLSYISAEIAGLLDNLAVQRGNFVKKGTLLVALDKRQEELNLKIYQQILESANADLEDAKAQHEYATADLKRKQKLYNNKFVSQLDLDTSLRLERTTKARLNSTYASILRTKSDIEVQNLIVTKKTIYSPFDSLVFDTYFTQGELVPAGRPILSLLASRNINVIFYVPQKELHHIKLGDEVNVFQNEKSKVKAIINFISPETEFTPPNLYSRDFREELSYRIEAAPTENWVLKPGEIVSVELIRASKR